jgi:hypothetical protein
VFRCLTVLGKQRDDEKQKGRVGKSQRARL